MSDANSTPRPSPGQLASSPVSASEAEAKAGVVVQTIEVPLECLRPTRNLNDSPSLRRYQLILASVRELGIIEPLTVCSQRDCHGSYLVIDGHLRYLALKQLGKTTAECTVVNKPHDTEKNNYA